MPLLCIGIPLRTIFGILPSRRNITVYVRWVVDGTQSKIQLTSSFKHFKLWYADGAGNTIEENSSIFSLVWMR